MTRLPCSPAFRYRQLSRDLSGVELLPLDSDDARVVARWEDLDDLWHRLNATAFAEELEIYGVLQGIAARGYHQIEVTLERAWTGSVVGRVFGVPIGSAASETLLELALWREHVVPAQAGAAWQALSVEQLVLRDPAAPFSAALPRLPGQDAAGMGVAMRILALLEGWGARLGVDVVAAIPEFFHSAVIYARAFIYVDAEMQGIFEAARRDLVGASHLADPSWTFEWGLVLRDEAPYLWPTELQAIPISAAARGYFDSPDYVATVDATRTRTRFAVAAEAGQRWPVKGRSG